MPVLHAPCLPSKKTACLLAAHIRILLLAWGLLYTGRARSQIWFLPREAKSFLLLFFGPRRSKILMPAWARIAGGLSLFYTPRAGSKIWYLRIPGRRGFAFSASSLQPQGSTFSPKFFPRPGEPLGFWWFFQPKVEKMNSFDVAQCILLTFLSSSALPSKIRV